MAVTVAITDNGLTIDMVVTTNGSAENKEFVKPVVIDLHGDDKIRITDSLEQVFDFLRSQVTSPSSTDIEDLESILLGYNNTDAANTQTVTSSATVTPDYLDDLIIITAQAVALTLANPTGTYSQGQAFLFRIKDNGTARAITYGAKYRALGITLPTTTTLSKTTYIGVIYNSTDDKFDCISTVTQA